jgi:hypothetical protein
MKKIYTLLLLFTITLFYKIDTEAFTLDSNDIAITALGGLTLNEVFDDNNLLDLQTLRGINSTLTFLDEIYILTITALISSNRFESAQNFANTGNVYYLNSSILPLHNTNTVFQIGAQNSSSFNLIPNIWNFLSSTITANNTSRFRLFHSSEFFYNIDDVWQVKDPTVINLTSLGLTSLTTFELDYYYNLWNDNNIFIQAYNEGLLASEAYSEGFSAGYEIGYGDGYQDAVEEDNAYALGYAKGLLEGEDMETGSSLLILIVAAIGFIMMIFGFATKRRIFNLLSVGAFIVLGGLLAEFVGFIIITVGLVFVNVYYTFFGDI